MNNNQGRRRTRRVRQQRKQKSTQISRILLTICMMALVAVVSIGGTLAWLTDASKPVVNTFTQSDVDIDLTETDSDGDNDPLNNSYKMIPGGTIAKDPKVTVLKDSEASWVFVKIEKSTNKAFDEYMEYAPADGWEKIEGVTDADVYYRKVAATTEDKIEFKVLANDQVKVKSDVTKAMMDELTADNYPKLTITAYAVQQDNLTTADGTSITDDAAAAWNIAKDATPVTTTP